MNRQRRFASVPRTAVVAALAVLGAGLSTVAQAQVTPGVQTLGTTRIAYRMSVDPADVLGTPNPSAEALAAKHNQSLFLAYPAGFTVRTCVAPAEFTCSVDGRRVAFSRQANSEHFSASDIFEVEVQVPGIRGIYRTPALQVYSDGAEIAWNSAEKPYPAPSVSVEGPDRAARSVTGTFVAIEDVEGKIACPKSAVTYAKQWRIDPGGYCAFAGYAPPTFSAASAGSEIEGTVRLLRSSGRTSLVVAVDGLEPGKAYASHLHDGTCAETTSPHYKNNLYGPSVPPNEMWPSSEPADAEAGLVADQHGRGVGRADASWLARPTARSVWIHQGTLPGAPDDEDHSAHIRIACADLS